jgi:hypothetical protein
MVDMKEPMTYEQFKERMDYYRELLNQQNISVETIEMVNVSMRSLLHVWNNPIIIFGSEAN